VTRASFLGLVAAWAPLAPLGAQHGLTARLSGQGILVGTHADPVAGGQFLGEVRLVQPIIMLDVGLPRLRLTFHATADFEGWTMPHGELAPGDWGEGYVDRRHPHTYVHELMLSAEDVLGHFDGKARTTLSVGKGFVPFGTDDPMSRPVERFPVNHHLSQILERALVMAEVDVGPATIEGAVFNGDEPESPGQSPSLSRVGDSWAARLTLRPLPGLEWQGSRAVVHSPENRAGAGTDARKWSTSVRADRRAGPAHLYALVEWARTSEADGVFVFHSVLAEAAVTAGRHQPYYRFERTERPEDMRTLDPFRSVRPHLDNSILGTSRWSIHTLGYGLRLGAPIGHPDVVPFIEVSYGRIATVDWGLFDPTTFYGRDSFWSASGGLRIAWGMRGHRMGRYGVPTRTMDMPAMTEPDRAR